MAITPPSVLSCPMTGEGQPSTVSSSSSAAAAAAAASTKLPACNFTPTPRPVRAARKRSSETTITYSRRSKMDAVQKRNIVISGEPALHVRPTRCTVASSARAWRPLRERHGIADGSSTLKAEASSDAQRRTT